MKDLLLPKEFCNKQSNQSSTNPFTTGSNETKGDCKIIYKTNQGLLVKTIKIGG